MRILYHHRTQAEDAQGIHIQEMVQAFRRLGHDVEVAAVKNNVDSKTSMSGHSSLWNWLVNNAPRWLYDIMSFFYNFYGYRMLCKRIRKQQIDLIYERYSLNTLCGIWCSRKYNIPILLEVNAPLYLEQKTLGKLSMKMLAKYSERWICSNSTYTIVVSEVMKKILTKEGVDAKKLIVMPNAVDPRIFNPSISGASVRRKCQLDKCIVIGFVGWFREWHGLEMLLEVCYDAGFFQQECKLLLVGDGPAYDALHDFAAKRALFSSVVFAGPVERKEIPEYIAAMDICVQPKATPYACPMKIIEYMAMAKCVIAPNQPNIREILVDDENGCLFRPREPEHFKAVLEQIVRNERKRNRIGQAAYKTVTRHRLFWEGNAQKALDLLGSDIINSKQERVCENRIEPS